MKGPRLWDFGPKYHLAIRVIPGEERVNIAAVPSIDHSVHELDVLLRHRPAQYLASARAGQWDSEPAANSEKPAGAT